MWDILPTRKHIMNIWWALIFFSFLSYNSFSQSGSFGEKYGIAKKLLAQNETAKALPFFQDLYKSDPNNSNINYLLGICLTEESSRSPESVIHLEKAIKDISLDYDGFSALEKRAPLFVYYYLTIAYSQHNRCSDAAKAKNYFQSLYGMEKRDYYIADAEKWVEKCRKNKLHTEEPIAEKKTHEQDTFITKRVDYTALAPLYGVQVGAFSKSIPVYEFDGLKNVEAFIDNDGRVRYVIGNFIYRSQAENLLKTVQNAGYGDAFIVDVNKEKKFSEELVIANNASLYKNSIEEVRFKVQIGAFKDLIPSEIAEIYLKLEGIEERHENNFTILSIGNFASYEEAEKYKTTILDQGISDAFIVAYSDEKKIDLNTAKSHYRKKKQ